VEQPPELAQERAGWVEVDMDLPRFGWEEVPLQATAPRVSTADLGLCHGPLRGGVAVSVGNPHVVFFLDAEASLADVDLAAPATQVQALSLFPEGVNVSLAQCRDEGRSIDLRVYERGAGETGACGTGACATFAAARRLGMCQPAADICFASGRLYLREREADGHLLMAGEAVEVFTGTLAPPLALLLEDR
jgi:diaminopimelate epimerase